MMESTRAKTARALPGVNLPHRLVGIAARLLPRSIRHELWRSLVRINPVPPRDLVIKLAETAQEYEQAFELLHDARIQAKHGAKQSLLHATKWHALPTTRVIVAKLGPEVVATVSVIRDSALGLPVERGASVEILRRRGTRLAQIGSFAMRPPTNIAPHTLALPLCKYVYEYCIRCFGVDTLVTAVENHRADFLQGIFFFNRCDFATSDEEEPATHSPRQALWMDLRSAYKSFAAHYGRKRPSRNLFRYFAELRLPELQFPARSRSRFPDPAMTPTLLDEFFNRRTDLFSTMTDRERDIVCTMYDQAIYGHILPRCQATARFRELRREPRFGAAAEGRVLFPRSRIVKLTLIDASACGMRAWLDEPIRFGLDIKATIALDNGEIADLECQPVWTDDRQVYGFLIQRASANWGAYLERLRINGQALEEEAPVRQRATGSSLHS